MLYTFEISKRKEKGNKVEATVEQIMDEKFQK